VGVCVCVRAWCVCVWVCAWVCLCVWPGRVVCVGQVSALERAYAHVCMRTSCGVFVSGGPSRATKHTQRTCQKGDCVQSPQWGVQRQRCRGGGREHSGLACRGGRGRGGSIAWHGTRGQVRACVWGRGAGGRDQGCAQGLP